MGSIDVRRLTPEDWRTFRDIRLAALADAPEAFSSSLAREQAYDDARWQAMMAPERGHPRVELWVVDGNDRATGLYRRLGFEFTGEEEPCADDPRLRDRRMARALPVV
ncbi:GNAT family N-acetyltransferase [Planomonospora venezuelensis]|uniref:Acetyltransferase (GNAT) family protein n=1 Tax=Planomonospora venezuelensis TaxID=1999 RepID=A0A841DAM0_PLAVE|nr:hypothetical protein [Planomonospora venezuelensis]MBB5965747.1 hypothetical protein [Planomonospora venezuelensis]GIM62315.1 hypothetical protein Pve01_75460 [Planomonospora venezuelensis]